MVRQVTLLAGGKISSYQPAGEACPYPLAAIQQFRRAWDDPLMVS